MARCLQYLLPLNWVLYLGTFVPYADDSASLHRLHICADMAVSVDTLFLCNIDSGLLHNLYSFSGRS